MRRHRSLREPRRMPAVVEGPVAIPRHPGRQQEDPRSLAASVRCRCRFREQQLAGERDVAGTKPDRLGLKHGPRVHSGSHARPWPRMPVSPGLPVGVDPGLFPPPQLVEFQPDAEADLPQGAEVVVVGAGFVGAWAAYHLAKAGMRPLVIEANAPASGASGRLCGLALAGVGGHFARVNALVRESSDHSIADYTRRSLDLLEAIHGELPGGIEWERCGSLDLLTNDHQEAHAFDLAETQRSEGLRIEMLAPDDLHAVAPTLDLDQVRGAKWTQGDGQLNPFKLVYGLLEAAHRMGARTVRGVRVEKVVARSGRVWGVDTSHGPIQASAVLLATNAWTPALAPAIAGNITPIREHVMVTERLPRTLMQGFETNQCNEYWRQEPTGELLIGGHAAMTREWGSAATRWQPAARSRPTSPACSAGSIPRSGTLASSACGPGCWTSRRWKYRWQGHSPRPTARRCREDSSSAA